MSLTGSIYKITNEELKIQIENNFSKISQFKREADISYFLIDFMEIMSRYSGLDKKIFRKILEGNNSFKPDDGFIGYSNTEEVKKDKTEILDKISVERFNEFLNTDLLEKRAIISKDNVKYLVEFYEKIKNSYENAYNENKALVFRIG